MRPMSGHREAALGRNPDGLLVVIVEDVAIPRLQSFGLNETDAVSLRVRSQDPGDFLHFAERGQTKVGVPGTGSDWERDPASVSVEAAAIDDLLSEARALNDGGVTASHAEGRFTVLDRASSDLDPHRRFSRLRDA